MDRFMQGEAREAIYGLGDDEFRSIVAAEVDDPSPISI